MATGSQVKTEEANAVSQEVARDPFIPLIDDKGNMRKVFKKPAPIQEIMAPQITLMGISKVGNAFYAIIDGELVKEGQLFKEMKIEKIYSDRIIVEYANRVFEYKLDLEKNDAKQ